MGFSGERYVLCVTPGFPEGSLLFVERAGIAPRILSVAD